MFFYTAPPATWDLPQPPQGPRNRIFNIFQEFLLWNNANKSGYVESTRRALSGYVESFRQSRNFPLVGAAPRAVLRFWEGWASTGASSMPATRKIMFSFSPCLSPWSPPNHPPKLSKSSPEHPQNDLRSPPNRPHIDARSTPGSQLRTPKPNKSSPRCRESSIFQKNAFRS